MLGTVLLSLAGAFGPAAAGAEITCDKVAGAGTPLVTGQALVDALAPGQTGCVRGTLTGNVAVRRDDVTLTSEPGQRGKLVGQLHITDGADRVTVRDLDLDGRRPTGYIISPLVIGDDATFTGNDVSNGNTGICFIIGSSGHDGDVLTERTRIVNNRVHDCGTSNNNMHGIYVEHAADTRIVGNEIFDNADRGIQLYPDAQRTVITGNIIDGNGEGIIFSGTGGKAASDNVVRGNIISNPRIRAGVESWYPAGNPKGTGNVVEFNCLHGSGELIDASAGGFTVGVNTTADPLYVDRAAKDFRLRPGSPCAALLEAGRAEAVTYPEPPRPEPQPDAPAQDTAPVSNPAPAPAPTQAPKARPAVKPIAKPTATEPVADLKVAAPRPKGKSAKIRIKVLRGKRGAVRLRVAVPKGRGVQALVEVRDGKKGWRAVAAPKLSAGRSFTTKTLKLKRGARKITARASVVATDEPIVTTLSVPVVTTFRR